MNRVRLAVAAAILLLTATSAFAHRLDEYLQATILSVEKDRVQARMRLVPGVAVASFVLQGVDTNADGVISEIEQRAYAERVLHDVSLKMDGVVLAARLSSVQFPEVAEMKEGMGEIQIEIGAELPRGGPKRSLLFENQHQNRIAVYLVNCLVPHDGDIRIITQKRNEQQSSYQLDYVQAGVSSNLAFEWWTGARGWFGAAAILLAARLAWLWRQRRLTRSRHA